MIESAKLRRVITEINNYKNAIYAFRAAKDRLPGDINNSGFIGGGSNQVYDDDSFGGNYVSANTQYGIPVVECAPFVDLYLEGIIDFEPKNNIQNIHDLYKGMCPTVSGFSNGKYYFVVVSDSKNAFYILNKEDQKTTLIPTSFFEKLDKKIDDGFINSGSMAPYCSPNANIWTGVAAESWESAKMCVFNRIFFID